MTPIAIAWAIMVGAFIILTTQWAIRLFQSSHWILSKNGVTRKTNQQVVVVIPLLKEQTRIPATAEYFIKTFDDITLVLVTTEAEGKANEPSTATVARKLSEKYPRIKHVHYTGKGRKMASQLNAAIDFLHARHTRPDTIVAIYNADSRPHKNTFRWVLNHREEGACVFQQYGAYWKNKTTRTNTMQKATLEAAAAWQTRWSMGFEIPHARAQDKNRKANKMNYCIGHGFIFELKNFKLFGPFNDKTHNEDAVLGLELNYRRIPIIPVPHLELAESPGVLRGWFTQQASWFYGPWQALKYHQHLAEKLGVRTLAQRARLAWLTAQLFSHAVYWLCGPTFLLLTIIIGALLGPLPFVISLAIAIIYTGGLNYLTTRLADKRNETISASSIIFGSLPQYLLHGAAAYYALMRGIAFRIAGKTIPKTRTVMENEKKTMGA